MLSLNTLWSLFYTNHSVQQSNLIYSRGSHLVHLTSDHFPPVADRGEAPAHPLILRPNWGPKGPKKFFGDCTPAPPPPLSCQGLDPALPSVNFSQCAVHDYCYLGPMPWALWVVHSSSCACVEVVHLTFTIFTQQAIFLRSVMIWWILIICSCAVLTCCTQTLYIRRIARICWIQTLKVISIYLLRIRTAFLGLKLVRNANEWFQIKIMNIWLSFIWIAGWRKKYYWPECCAGITEVRVGIPASLNVFSSFLFTTGKVAYLVFLITRVKETNNNENGEVNNISCK